MIDFDELRERAATVRSFIQTSSDQVNALKSVVSAFDVVLGIFPSPSEGIGLHVIKGDLSRLTDPHAMDDYSHTAIAFQNREQAVALRALVA